MALVNGPMPLPFIIGGVTKPLTILSHEPKEARWAFRDADGAIELHSSLRYPSALTSGGEESALVAARYTELADGIPGREYYAQFMMRTRGGVSDPSVSVDVARSILRAILYSDGTLDSGSLDLGVSTLTALAGRSPTNA